MRRYSYVCLKAEEEPHIAQYGTKNGKMRTTEVKIEEASAHKSAVTR